MAIAGEIRAILEPAHGPCPYMAECESSWKSSYGEVPRETTLWNPRNGWAPRGFCGATAGIGSVELVLVLAEPSRPDSDERYPENCTVDAVAQRSMQNLELTKSRHHGGLLRMLQFFFPGLAFSQIFERAFKVESVLCSIPAPLPQNGEKKAVTPLRVETNCLDNYVLPLLRLFPNALIVAAGKKKSGTGDTERRIRLHAVREGFSNRVRYVYHPSFWAQGGMKLAEQDWAKAATNWREVLGGAHLVPGASGADTGDELPSAELSMPQLLPTLKPATAKSGKTGAGKLMRHLSIRPTNRGADVRDAHRFIEMKMREYRGDHGRWPTVNELIDMSVTASERGEWRAQNDSNEFRLTPDKYFVGYILSGLRPARDIFEYDVD